MLERHDNLLLAGASGVGKTTLAKSILELGVPNLVFSSGSTSDLLPLTKGISHKDMLNRSDEDLLKEDYQIITMRKRNILSINENDYNVIMDRSFLDSAAYFFYKQLNRIPPCELEHFLNICKELTVKLCPKLVFIPFTTSMLDSWVIEDNNKRIKDKYFQFHISKIMDQVLDIWGATPEEIYYDMPNKWYETRKHLDEGFGIREIKSVYGKTQILVLREVNMNNRIELVKKFINGKL